MLRGAARAEEIGIRLSLGASRARVFSQLLAESALLAAAGGGAGVLLARWAQGLLPAIMPPSPLPLALDAGWDARRWGSRWPSRRQWCLCSASRPRCHTLRRAVLPTASRTTAGGTRSAARVRAILVVAQLALSMAALVSAGAFLRVNAGLAAVDRGLRSPDHVLVASTDLDQAGYHTQEARVQVADRLLSGVRALPGVDSAALATFVPLGFTGYSSVSVIVPGYVPDRDEDVSILSNRVSPGYFETMGIAILQGRPIEARDTDGSPLVAVVNDAFVRRFMSAALPVGRDIDVGGRRMRIVGVAADGKYRFDALDQPSPPFIYIPYAQQSRATTTLHVRTQGRPQDVLPSVRLTLAGVNPALSLSSPTTLDRVHVVAAVSGQARHGSPDVAGRSRAAPVGWRTVRRARIPGLPAPPGTGGADGARRLGIRPAAIGPFRRRSTGARRARPGRSAWCADHPPDRRAPAKHPDRGPGGAPRGPLACSSSWPSSRRWCRPSARRGSIRPSRSEASDRSALTRYYFISIPCGRAGPVGNAVSKSRVKRRSSSRWCFETLMTFTR